MILQVPLGPGSAEFTRLTWLSWNREPTVRSADLKTPNQILRIVQPGVRIENWPIMSECWRPRCGLMPVADAKNRLRARNHQLPVPLIFSDSAGSQAIDGPPVDFLVEADW